MAGLELPLAWREGCLPRAGSDRPHKSLAGDCQCVAIVEIWISKCFIKRDFLSQGLGAMDGQRREVRKADKSIYTLFHPTPREWMREMSTDRPDQTESPNTVDAGHFQVELD